MVILHIKRQTENNILNETEKKTAREQVPGPLNSDELSFDLRLTFTLLQRCEIWIKSELVSVLWPLVRYSQKKSLWPDSISTALVVQYFSFLLRI